MPLDQTKRHALALTMLLLLGACAPRPADPPVPVSTGGRPDLTLPRTPSTDASLPSASTVFNAPATAADPAASVPQARANAEMTAAQESRAMPMPGQANDHSVPVVPPKAAASR